MKKKKSEVESISLAKFLVRYYGVKHPNIKNLTHSDVKDLFKDIRRASFEFAQNNPEMIASGEIIYVDDGHNIIPYYASLKDMNFEYEDFECVKVTKEKLEKIEATDLKNLTKWELIQILREYKGYTSCWKKIHREMESRGMIVKVNRKKEYNAKYKEQ